MPKQNKREKKAKGPANSTNDKSIAEYIQAQIESAKNDARREKFKEDGAFVWKLGPASANEFRYEVEYPKNGTSADAKIAELEAEIKALRMTIRNQDSVIEEKKRVAENLRAELREKDQGKNISPDARAQYEINAILKKEIAELKSRLKGSQLDYSRFTYSNDGSEKRKDTSAEDAKRIAELRQLLYQSTEFMDRICVTLTQDGFLFKDFQRAMISMDDCIRDIEDRLARDDPSRNRRRSERRKTNSQLGRKWTLEDIQVLVDNYWGPRALGSQSSVNGTEKKVIGVGERSIELAELEE